jgi:hypothetical protein
MAAALGATALPSSAGAQNCIFVMYDNPATTADDVITGNNVDSSALAQRFVQARPDTFDFWMVFTDFNVGKFSGQAHGADTIRVFNDIQGIGVPNIDNRINYGPSSRLDAYVEFNNVVGFPAPTATFAASHHTPLSLLAHQTGRRWAPDVQALGNMLGVATPTVVQGQRQWSFYLGTPHPSPEGGSSSLGGNRWVDNGNGTFTTDLTPGTDGFSGLDQYLMGLREEEAVAPFFLIASPTQVTGQPAPPAANAPPWSQATPLTVGGTRTDITIQDVINTQGARAPLASEATKNFRQAFILVTANAARTTGNGNPSPSDAVVGTNGQLETLRQEWEEYFQVQTEGGSVDTCVGDRPLDILFLLDLTGSYFDDLPTFTTALPGLMATIKNQSSNARFALATFKDFPFAPFGDPSDFAFQLNAPLPSLQTPPTDGGASLITALLPGLIATGGADLPESQYEALFQALTGNGLSLGAAGGAGDIPASNLNRRPGANLFIFLFTDAPFHDAGLEANYPCPVAQCPNRALAATRASVLSELQNTPVIFGMASGADANTPQLQELADMTGGTVFELRDDSTGFDARVLEAIATTDPEPELDLSLLDSLSVERATIHWSHGHALDGKEHDHDDPHGACKRDHSPPKGHGSKGSKHKKHGKKPAKKPQASHVNLQGRLALPAETDRATLAPLSHVVIAVSGQQVVDAVLSLEVDPAEPDVWHFEGAPGSAIEGLNIVWKSATEAEYALQGHFDAEAFGLDGNTRPAIVTLLMALGEQMLSRQAFVDEAAWKVLTRKHWSTGGHVTGAIPDLHAGKGKHGKKKGEDDGEDDDPADEPRDGRHPSRPHHGVFDDLKGKHASHRGAPPACTVYRAGSTQGGELAWGGAAALLVASALYGRRRRPKAPRRSPDRS